MPEFPHMQKHEFPKGSNVDVYKYDNAFDYARFDFDQMDVQVCTVPWDMGEARVGNRIISGIGNVVFFGSKERRNAWFDAIPDGECFRWKTKSKELHRENIITVPLPFDVASKYNYVRVHYHLFANDESPVMYEDDDGLNDWFWFVREVEFVSPNTTKLHLLNDAWQTFIYDVDIPYMVLERGHAPMHASDVDTYLSAPMDNCRYLLADDVRSENARSNIETLSPLVFDEGHIFVVFVTNANVRKAWGAEYSDAWRTRTSTYYVQDGQLSYTHFAVAAENFNDFVNKIDADVPQFAQCVECVYLVSSDLVSIRETLSFMGFNVHLLSADEHRKMLFDLDKDAFGYPDAYKDIAKLYTYPYAYIDVQDEKGRSCVVRIEEMATSRLDVQCALNTAFPALNIYACLVGIGERAESAVTFTALADRQVHIGGKRFETTFEWALPKFGVFQDTRAQWDFEGHFERVQAASDYTTAYQNATVSTSTAKVIAVRSADTAKANADRSADTAKANADASADTAKANADRSADTSKANADASADTAKANADRSADTSKANADRSADAAKANTTTHTQGIATARNAKDTELTKSRNIANYLITQQNTWQAHKLEADRDDDLTYMAQGLLANVDAVAASAWTNAASGVIGGIVSGGVAGGVAGGPVGAAGGAVVGGVGGLVSGIAGSVSANITISKDQSLTSASQQNLREKTLNATAYMQRQENFSKEANRRSANKDTEYNDAIANNNISVLNTQATLTQSTAKSNASATQSAEKTNASATQSTAKSNASATQSTEKTNASATQRTEKAIASATQSAAKANASATRTTANDNSTNQYETAIANATRTRDNEIERISNQIRDKGLNKPFTYGVFADGESATTRPKMLIPRIVHDSMADISYAGDAMLRYGYYLNQNWVFDGSWCLDGHKFSYWKLADFWVQGLDVPDMYMDKLRFFLLGGVTVWATPEDIGRTSIYENGY